jgi:protocatechuate 3,4-dioxygenase beta subunit
MRTRSRIRFCSINLLPNFNLMERKEFLKALGMVSIVSPLITSCKDEDITPDSGSSPTCTVGDTETDGPYPLYNSRGSSIQRLDITDGKTGTPLNMTITVKDVNNNCAVVENARVDIWHCDKDGYYSGYSNSGYLGTQNNSDKVFCRGLQYSDASGQVKFLTIYPGWYTGRVTHIHAQVYVDSKLKLTTQIAFPEEINTAVYNSDLYKAHGQNSTKNTTDNIISDSLDNELATVKVNGSSYDLEHTLFIKV